MTNSKTVRADWFYTVMYVNVKRTMVDYQGIVEFFWAESISVSSYVKFAWAAAFWTIGI